ncbi:HLH transcription factor, putative [Penicillium digitatum]|uniref:HLH transcription factor, putative n=3 Tax=Penicillium digitatum TaxID=36651 RepID=K9FRS3_PEND2|nr:HLH transcription factor, putative [Penicillium digitatum Pd1]EKV04025.1 HLH transcription factor, putative [Penicillium digitatum Pd1]EKV05403.1 HLH transcription factor, putative [Penicillium digitatum PHI26]KAG0160715.1 hypothetical protein PDIDSM_8245 [Penicillium digitatum]QQK45175.1 HLH transcription factor, putative [Penicillium digitatum]
MNGHATEVQTGRTSPPAAPFGYSFLSPMDTPFEQAPALPPGPSLLDDNESNMLDNFFTTMNANHFTNDFWMRQEHKSGAPILDWPGELPPNFEGSTTSLSQPSFQQHGLGKTASGMMTDNPTSSDIFAAASMLYHSGLSGSELGSTLAHQNFVGQSLPAPGIQQKNNSHAGSAAHCSTLSPPRADVPIGYHTSEMFFDVRDPIPADQHPSNNTRSLRWGSDAGFMDQGYLRPPDQPDEEQRTNDLLNHLGCFEPQSSAANTRGPSPERITGAPPQGPAFQSGAVLDEGLHPRKRTRALKEEGDECSDDADARPHLRKHKGSIGKGRRVSTDMYRKARLQPGSKAARENLTEEQKRTNHILSEQKRRNLIRQGFEDLCTLVPALRGGGFSKSAMLTGAADWLEDLLHGNDILQSQLHELKGINGMVMPR